MPLTCQDGHVFNASSHECVVGETCKPCTSPVSSCVYECLDASARETVKIPSFDDCYTFYMCEGNELVDSDICRAPTPFFDGAKCQADETRCCHCHAYCYKGDVDIFIPDPLDCRKYYRCTDAGENPTLSGKCPNGEFFDHFLGRCSATATCNTMCLNVLRPDGCIEPFTCLSPGLFARCPNQCTAAYYSCTEVTDEYQEAKECTGGTVFHPDTHACVNPSNCP